MAIRRTVSEIVSEDIAGEGGSTFVCFCRATIEQITDQQRYLDLSHCCYYQFLGHLEDGETPSWWEKLHQLEFSTRGHGLPARRNRHSPDDPPAVLLNSANPMAAGW